MQSNQIYLSVLKTAIQKALTKNLPQILDDAVQYLESHDIQVKQKKKRSKSKPLQNIDDLQKKTQSASAKKIKSTPFFNLNTNRIVSDKIGTKYPRMKFGNIKQDDKIVWVCGTPGHLKNTLATLKQSDEKTEPIFDPILEEPEDDQLSEEESIAQDEEQLLSEEEESIALNEDHLSEEEPITLDEEQEEPIALNEGEDENSIENSHLDDEQLSEKNIFDFEGQSSEENIFDFAGESSLNEVLQLSENSVDNLELELKPQKSKKLKRRRKKKKSKKSPAPPTSPSPQPPMPPSIRNEFTPINIFLED